MVLPSHGTKLASNVSNALKRLTIHLIRFPSRIIGKFEKIYKNLFCRVRQCQKEGVIDHL
jgi:hypothetical protein